jgi:hypothetical protein
MKQKAPTDVVLLYHNLIAVIEEIKRRYVLPNGNYVGTPPLIDLSKPPVSKTAPMQVITKQNVLDSIRGQQRKRNATVKR